MVAVVVVEDEDLVVQVGSSAGSSSNFGVAGDCHPEFQIIKFRNYWILLNLSNQLVVKCRKGRLEIIKLVAVK